MKNKLHIILASVLGIVCLAAIVVGMIGSRRDIDSRKCHGIRIVVTDEKVIRFADKNKVKFLIDSAFGGYVNVPLDNLDLWRMEKILREQVYTADADCWCTGDGYVNVRMSQIPPVAKFIRRSDYYYICEDGRCIRSGSDWNDEIILISGKPRLNDRDWMRDMGAASARIDRDRQFLERIDTLECTSSGECIFHLSDRNEMFLAGYPDGLEKKLDKIREYERGVHGEYGTVDLRYRGQIICK